MYVILYTCVLCMFEIHLCVCVHMMAMWYRMYYGNIHVHTLGTTGMQTIPNKNREISATFNVLLNLNSFYMTCYSCIHTLTCTLRLYMCVCICRCVWVVPLMYVIVPLVG